MAAGKDAVPGPHEDKTPRKRGQHSNQCHCAAARTWMEWIQNMGTAQLHLASWPQSCWGKLTGICPRTIRVTWIVLCTNLQTCCRARMDRSADPEPSFLHVQQALPKLGYEAFDHGCSRENGPESTIWDPRPLKHSQPQEDEGHLN